MKFSCLKISILWGRPYWERRCGTPRPIQRDHVPALPIRSCRRLFGERRWRCSKPQPPDLKGLGGTEGTRREERRSHRHMLPTTKAWGGEAGRGPTCRCTTRQEHPTPALSVYIPPQVTWANRPHSLYTTPDCKIGSSPYTVQQIPSEIQTSNACSIIVRTTRREFLFRTQDV
jgi:hypothetical protein